MGDYPFGVLEGRTDRGIPKVLFVDDVGELLKQEGADTKSVIETLQKVHQELGRIEQRLTGIREQIKEAIPDLEENLRVLEFCKAKKDADPIETNFQVSASIFAEAKLDQAEGKVVLWLGANTAVELTYEEAADVLGKNLAKKKEQLAQYDEDMRFVKKQITTTEVSIARVYNNDVKERRKQRDEEAAGK